ncbi:MAG: hypothetical protein ACPG52_04100 [Cognaticolwellia sp.]
MKETITDNKSENSSEDKNAEQRLQAAIAQLPQELTPARDLWPGIEKAISQNAGHTVSDKTAKIITFTPTAWAASVVAAILLTWVTLDPEQSASETSSNLVATMQQNFQQQKQTMLVTFGGPDISQLPVAMQTELTKLSSAQKTISKALADDPNNSDLLNLLRWTQQQELDLLKQLYSPQWQTI